MKLKLIFNYNTTLIVSTNTNEITLLLRLILSCSENWYQCCFWGGNLNRHQLAWRLISFVSPTVSSIYPHRAEGTEWNLGGSANSWESSAWHTGPNSPQKPPLLSGPSLSCSSHYFPLSAELIWGNRRVPGELRPEDIFWIGSANWGSQKIFALIRCVTASQLLKEAESTIQKAIYGRLPPRRVLMGDLWRNYF